MMYMMGPNIDSFVKCKRSKTWQQYFFGTLDPEPGLIKNEAEISPHLDQLIQEVKRDMIHLDNDKSRVEFRSIFAIFPLNFGSIFTYRDKSPPYESMKAISLLPDYLNVLSMKDLKAGKLNQLLQKEYDWSVPTNEMWLSGAGKLLVDSFLLSDKAKKFLIAKELNCCYNTDVLEHGPLIFFVVMIYFSLQRLIWRYVSGGPHAPKTMLGFITSGLCSFILCFGTLYLMSIVIYMQKHNSGESRALSLGLQEARDLESNTHNRMHTKNLIDPDYYEGAIEFYSKCIQRNQSLRYLMKADHEAKGGGLFNRKYSRFTEDGNYKPSSLSVEPDPSDRIQKIRSWKYGRKRPKFVGKMFHETMALEREEEEEARVKLLEENKKKAEAEAAKDTSGHF